MPDPGRRTVGLVGLFEDEETLKRAAEAVRDAGYRRWDCHTPYPVHGLDKAMGMGSSPVPRITLGAGLAGFVAAVALTGGINVYQYPLLTGGKPLFSWQAYVPIYFELFVLFAAVSTLAAVVVLGRLGRWHSPLHDTGVMREITGDRFAVVLEAGDEKFTSDGARRLLESAGCQDIRDLVEEGEAGEEGGRP